MAIRGVLVVVGSAHPAAHAQLDALVAAGRAEVVRVCGDAVTVGRTASARLASGTTVALAPPRDSEARSPERVLRALRDATMAALDAARPAGLAIVGGETAYAVLDALGHPALRLRRRVAPLVVHAEIGDGALAGLAVVTKGGSTGAADLLGRVVTELRGGGAA